MNRWLVKGDPEDYSAADLERERRTEWSGVRNPVAQGHLREMKIGDEVLVYHTGGEKAVVALARVAAGPRPDTGDQTGKLVVVDLEFVRWLKNPVTLAAIKADSAFADFLLVRIGRLSVMPVNAGQWKRIMELAGE
jgi:predicted RNA-binding protein with PUA-like domain